MSRLLSWCALLSNSVKLMCSVIIPRRLVNYCSVTYFIHNCSKYNIYLVVSYFRTVSMRKDESEVWVDIAVEFDWRFLLIVLGQVMFKLSSCYFTGLYTSTSWWRTFEPVVLTIHVTPSDRVTEEHEGGDLLRTPACGSVHRGQRKDVTSPHLNLLN